MKHDETLILAVFQKKLKKEIANLKEAGKGPRKTKATLKPLIFSIKKSRSPQT